MTNYRTLGTWLRAYQGCDPIGDLRDDFAYACRSKNILASSIKTGVEMEKHMFQAAYEHGSTPCEDAWEALEEACILYGDPWRMDRDEDDDREEGDKYEKA